MNAIETVIDKIKTILQGTTGINYVVTQRTSIDKFVTAEIVRNGFTFEFEENRGGRINLDLDINLYINMDKEKELSNLTFTVLDKFLDDPTLSDTCRVNRFNNTFIEISRENINMLKAGINLDVEIYLNF